MFCTSCQSLGRFIGKKRLYYFHVMINPANRMKKVTFSYFFISPFLDKPKIRYIIIKVRNRASILPAPSESYFRKKRITMAQNNSAIRTRIDIFSGFLGAGKTTLIKKLIQEAYQGEQLVLIENEFGEIGIDGGFMKEAGIQINELNSGCICCSLVGDFGEALHKVLEQFKPDRILVEPSGVGKLSDVIRAVKNVTEKEEGVMLNGFCTIVDAGKCKMYMKNFGEFFNDQIEHANTILLSHTGGQSEAKVAKAVELVREKNPDAVIVTTEWEQLDGKQILQAMEQENTIESALKKLAEETEEEHHHHHHDHDEDEHDHEHEHHHDEDEEEHEHHHHHDDDDDEDEHGHHHHHHDEDGEETCSCGCHHDHEHGHHHADEIFTSWGVETAKKYSKDEIETILEQLLKDTEYGMVLRAKGIVENKDGGWIHFDYVPGEPDVRSGSAEITGRFCVIGSNLKEDKLAELFGTASES